MKSSSKTGLAYASNGTPSDCVSLALLGVIEQPIDLVISGINKGPNLGWDIAYSGTVSAALEGALNDKQSIAISEVTYDADVDYSVAASVCVELARILEKELLPENSLLNVNVPAIPVSDIKGVALTRQGRRMYSNTIRKAHDPNGKDYYWLGAELASDDQDEDTDIKAIEDGWVSVTLVHLDLTHHLAMESIKNWGIEKIRLGHHSFSKTILP